MSLIKRQLSSSKLKFDSELYKVANSIDKKRPGSGQPMSTITSPIPPRKPVYSGKQRNLIVPQETPIQHHRFLKNQIPQQATQTTSQSQLPSVISPQKSTKPPLERKLIILKQETSPTSQQKSTSQSKQILTGERKPIQKFQEKQGQLTSPSQPEKQFTWNNQIELVVTQSDIENKRRQISHEKLKQIPKKQFQVLEQKRTTQPAIQQTQSHIVQTLNKQPNNNRKIVFNNKLINTNSSVQQLQTSQPKCFNDFTMTSGRNDLQQIFASMQQQLKEAASMADQHPVLNMSEISEQPEEANSSLAQSTQFQK